MGITLSKVYIVHASNTIDEALKDTVTNGIKSRKLGTDVEVLSQKDFQNTSIENDSNCMLLYEATVREPDILHRQESEMEKKHPLACSIVVHRVHLSWKEDFSTKRVFIDHKDISSSTQWSKVASTIKRRKLVYPVVGLLTAVGVGCSLYYLHKHRRSISELATKKLHGVVADLHGMVTAQTEKLHAAMVKIEMLSNENIKLQEQLDIARKKIVESVSYYIEGLFGKCSISSEPMECDLRNVQDNFDAVIVVMSHN
jgi:hypothetical protein